MVDANRAEGIARELIVPADMRLTYSDAIIVTATDNEVVLSFFQTVTPVLVTDITPQKTVPAVCMARIATTHAKAKELLSALTVVFGEHLEEEKKGKK
jgi:hypothetical protein